MAAALAMPRFRAVRGPVISAPLGCYLQGRAQALPGPAVSAHNWTYHGGSGGSRSESVTTRLSRGGPPLTGDQHAGTCPIRAHQIRPSVACADEIEVRRPRKLFRQTLRHDCCPLCHPVGVPPLEPGRRADLAGGVSRWRVDVKRGGAQGAWPDGPGARGVSPRIARQPSAGAPAAPARRGRKGLQCHPVGVSPSRPGQLRGSRSGSGPDRLPAGDSGAIWSTVDVDEHVIAASCQLPR